MHEPAGVIEEPGTTSHLDSAGSDPDSAESRLASGRAAADSGPHPAPTADPAPNPAPTPTPDATIFNIAARQHGVVSRSQLLEAGVPSHVIEYRLRIDRLRVLHRGVYSAGPVATRHQRQMAALLACGERAVLSHWTAAAISEMIRPRTDGPVDVSGSRSLRGPRAGVRIHRCSRLHPDEVELRHGLRLTTPARTLIDLASCLGPLDVERILARAERQQIVTRDALEAVLSRHTGRSGTRLLRSLLEAADEPALTRSEAEMRFLELVRKSGIPQPRVNVIVGGFEVDFVWPARRLVVEIDGFEHHRRRAAFEGDRGRDCALTAAGFRVMRFTWRRLVRESEMLLVELAQALAHGMSEPTVPNDAAASRPRRERARFARGTVA